MRRQFELGAHLFIASLLLAFASISGCTPSTSAPQYNDDYSLPKSPAEELDSFVLKPGYRIELVASEPLVEDPVIITFDEAGRLWVVEMRGFMLDVEGSGEDAPIGRISILWDDNSDGVMDRRTTFMDSLVMPRSLAIVEGGALVAENLPLWFVEDTDGDLVADKKTLIDATYGGSGLPEHSPNGLLRGLDNWYYNAKATARYRKEGNEWIKEETEFRGQWGISQDDKGRLYYNYNWSQLHADIVPPNYLSRNAHHTPTSGIDVGLTINRSIYPIRSNRAVNRGAIPGNLNEEGKLLEFTSASAPLVYRGTAIPEFYGDVFVCEPAGNLIKRNVLQEEGVSLTAAFAYPDSEFLASTDERFRPVSLATGPDGALYISDMYKGIIQHGAYMTPYLKEQSIKRKLVEPVHLGRIWRIVPEDWSPPASQALAKETTAELVARLSHPDGWHRDTAQRLLVEQQNNAALPLLRKVIQTSENKHAQLHALWTLQGLGETQPATYLEALSDNEPAVQAAALRILEQLAQTDGSIPPRMERIIHQAWQNAAPEFLLQIALSAGILKNDTKIPLLLQIANQESHQPVFRDAVLSGLENAEFAFFKTLWNTQEWATQQDDKSIFLEMLTTAIARKNNPAEITDVLATLEKAVSANDWKGEVLLTSLSLHARQSSTPPIKLAKAPAVFQENDSFSPEQQAQLSTMKRMFEWPGHQISEASAAENYLSDPETQELFALGRQLYLAGCAGCHGNNGAGLPRFAPPLVQSEWVLGSEERLTRLVLHGVEGPIEVNGKLYDTPDILPVMPGHSVLDDKELASILTFIRQAWNHQAPPIARRTVGRIRHGSQGRVIPWTAEELLEIE
ncbi:MAG: HEAT repeat domain-containing protein [Rhodothermales bacterium]